MSRWCSPFLFFLVIEILKFITALSPPHPDAGNELKQVYNDLRGNSSQLREITHPYLCNGESLTASECQTLHRNFRKKSRNLKIITETTGYLRVLVLCIRFTDHKLRELPTEKEYDKLFNSPRPDDVFAPAGSIKNYLEQNSYGNLEVDFDIMPWKDTNNTETYYSFNRSGLLARLSASTHSVMDQLEKDGVNWTVYDQNGDGRIDATIILHSGYAAEIGRSDCYSGAKYKHRIWSHALSSVANAWVSPSTGIGINNYAISSGLNGICNSRSSYPGVLTHEFLHLFDLYDLNDGSGEYIGQGLGHFSIMSNPFGANNRNTHPSNLSPWEKVSLNWIEPLEIKYDGIYHIRPSEKTEDIYVIRKNFPSKYEYFYIENRQPIQFDSLLWNGGLLIWHIDDRKNLMRERGYPGQPGWPSNNKHYQIALIQADRAYGLETGQDMGQSSDFFTRGFELGPTVIEQESNTSTYPNTNSYSNGNITQTGIRIYDISKSKENMTFKVEGLGPAPITMIQSSFPTTTMPTTFIPSSQSVGETSIPVTKPISSKKPSRFSKPDSASLISMPSISPSIYAQTQYLPTSTLNLPTAAPFFQPFDAPAPASRRKCQAIGQPCLSFLECCSLRCYTAAVTVSICFDGKVKNKDQLKLSHREGTAPSNEYII